MNLIMKEPRRWFAALGLALAGQVCGAQTGTPDHYTGTVTTSGRVLDASGGPVSGARLSVMPTLGVVTEVTSEADGKYSITWQARNLVAPGVTVARRGGPAPPAAQYLLVACDTQHNLAAAVPIDDQTKSMDIQLAGALAILGSVQDTRSAAVKNATVTLQMTVGRATGSFGRQQPVRADGDGAFSFTNLPPGQAYTLYVRAAGYGTASLALSADDTRTTSLELPPIILKVANLKLEGQVVDANDKPVSGAQVIVMGTDQPNANAVSDSKGHFVFNQVCEGPVRVLAINQGLANGVSASGTAPAQGGDLNVVVALRNNTMATPTIVRQAPTRTSPLKEQSWNWVALREWPRKHRTAVTILLCLQGGAILGAAGSIIWMTRRQRF